MFPAQTEALHAGGRSLPWNVPDGEAPASQVSPLYIELARELAARLGLASPTLPPDRRSVQ